VPTRDPDPAVHLDGELLSRERKIEPEFTYRMKSMLVHRLRCPEYFQMER
jgi:hypothetical protein